MEPEQHSLGLGGVLASLHFLEFSLRFYLVSLDPSIDEARWTAWEGLRTGDSTAENAFTNYDTMGQLIDKFNRMAPAANRIDVTIVALRDALAHGRVLTEGGFPMRLVKFSRPVSRVVMVEYAELVDPDWILRQMERVKGETSKVRDLIMSADVEKDAQHH